MPGKQIEIAKDLVLPMRAVTEMFAFLGRRGSGKTYGASKMAEEMLFNGAQVIVVDPMGVWYGLRLEADGKKPSGIDIPVFGGLRGDLPLTPESGVLVADLLVDRRISAILDVSQMIDAEINRFCTAFGERLFQRMKAKPSPVHLVLEECQEFLPQNIMKGEEKKLHVYQRIAKQGRSFGIGLSLISQRPQEINKKALNMIEVMFAFQMTGPQERKAIELWVADKGEDLDIVNLLPKFKVGEPHVWSPQWLKMSKQVHIAKKQTFDASATPEFGSHEAARELTPVDVAKIREAMREMIAQAEADDPVKLKREIARLQKELKAAQSAQPAVKEVERVEVPIIKEDDLRALKTSVDYVNKTAADLSEMVMTFNTFAKELSAALQKASLIGKQPMKYQIKSQPMSTSTPKGTYTYRPPITKPERLTNEGITNPMQRILDAIAWLESIGIDTPKQAAVAFLANYSYGGGAYNNPRGALRSMRLVEYVGTENIRLTDEGRKVAHFPDVPLTADELQRHVMSVLPGPHQKILSVLLEKYPNPITKDECAALAGYAPSGAFNNPLGRLRSMGLVNYPQPGFVVAEPLLFLE